MYLDPPRVSARHGVRGTEEVRAGAELRGLRLLDDLIRFLDHDNLTNRYYHVALAGAALGVVPPPASDSSPPAVAPAHWRHTFVDHVRATVQLTEGALGDIYIVQHQDCGAFKLLVDGFKHWDEADQRACNERYARALVGDLRDHFCAVYNGPHEHADGRAVQERPPAVHAFYMDLRGSVWHIDSHVPAKGARCDNYLCHCAPPAGVPTAPAPREVARPTGAAGPPKTTTRAKK